VPSSISNSSLRAPDAPYMRIWFASLLMVIIVLAIVEILWREHGFQPSVRDSYDLWANKRHHVYDKNHGKPLVIIGQSRIHMGFSHKTFNKFYPDIPVVNLATRTCPQEVLYDLARDTDFHGTLLVSFVAQCLARKGLRQIKRLKHYHKKWNYNSGINAAIAAAIQSRLVVVSSRVQLKKTLLNLLFEGTLPKVSVATVASDRSTLMDYSKINLVSQRAYRLSIAQRIFDETPVYDTIEWLRHVKLLQSAILSIQLRGGKVVLVRYPSAEEYWEMDESSYPRKKYWDLLSQHTTANAVIHFQDVPGMDEFKLPDTSHLSNTDVPAFTELLVNEMTRQGVLFK